MGSQNIKVRISAWPWYVLFAAIVPLLILYANNLGEATLDSLWRPLLASGLLGVLIYGATYLIVRESQKAALITLVLELIVFSYGHIYNLLEAVILWGEPLGRHRYLAPLFLLLAGLLVWWLSKRQAHDPNLTRLLNSVTLILFLLQVVRIGYFEVRASVVEHQNTTGESSDVELQSMGEQRDIYLIVLDSYTRSDWLQEWSGIDNSDFLAELEALGFYVADCSRSNYSYTIQSMTSELNMNFVQDLNVPQESTAMSVLLKDSTVRNMLEERDYEFIAFETDYPWINIRDADRYYKADTVNLAMDNFEFLYFKTTLLAFPYDIYLLLNPEVNDSITVRHAAQVKSIFTHLQEPLRESQPVFVYAHVISPHDPRVFNANGTINYNWEGDPDNVQKTYAFVNDQTLKVVKSIIERSDPEPIIIIQSDHGDGEGAYRNLNLNAYYLPEGGSEALYPTISPVNTFRVIFNEYFQGDFPLLEDISYNSPKGSRYEFEPVMDPYENCQPTN